MNEFDVITEIRKQVPATRFIIMSSDTSSDTLRRAMLAGAHNFLGKPISPDDLYSTIRSVVGTSISATLSAPPPSHAPMSKRRGLPLRPKPDKEPAVGPHQAREEEKPRGFSRLFGDPESPAQTPESQPQSASTVPSTPDIQDTQPQPEKAGEPSQPDLAQTYFSAFYPREAIVDRNHGLYVYAHLESALASIQSDIEKFKDELGAHVPAPRTAKQFFGMQVGTPVTIIPESDTLQFEPESLTKRWRGPFTRFDFDFFPSPEIVDETAFVRVSVQVANIEVANIKCAIDVKARVATVLDMPAPVENPLALARFANQRAETYQKIFISYSREDSEVARIFQMAQLAMGNEVFIDVDGIRAGENWQAALARAIDSADTFQLFWSSSYANSAYCRYEWDYALKYRCPDNRCEGFIRPVYWVNPMAVLPPAELSHLNFKYIPLST